MRNIAPSPSLWLRLIDVGAALAWWACVLLALTLAIAWAGLHWFIVPKIGEFRPELERRLGQSLGTKVQIAQLQAETVGFHTRLTLGELALLDRDNRPSLWLPKAEILISPRSLLELSFDQLVVEGADVLIRRDTSGRWTVGGFDAGSETARPNDPQPMIDWFFSQDEIAVVNARVRVRDDYRGQPALNFERVNLISRNRGSTRAFRLDATPPPTWGSALGIRGRFRAPLFGASAGEWRSWQGQVFADFDRADVAVLREALELKPPLQTGQGAVRVWADLEQGRFSQLTADLALVDATAQLQPQTLPLRVNRLQGRLQTKHRADLTEISVDDLRFDLGDGGAWNAGNWGMKWRGPGSVVRMSPSAEALLGIQLPDHPNTQGEFRADHLNLAAMGILLKHVPLSTATHALLSEVNPKGEISGLTGQWRGTLWQPKSYSVKGKVRGLSLTAAPSAQSLVTGTKPPLGRPGVQGLDADFEANDKEGKARVVLRDGAVTLPGVFEVPRIELDRVNADLAWKISAYRNGLPAVELQVENFKLGNTHTQAIARATWQTVDPTKASNQSRFPGILDLSGEFQRAELAHAWKYLPQSIPKSARDYVREAVTAGTGSNLKFAVKGNLYNMPFDRPSDGTFSIVGPVRGVGFAYVPKSFLVPGQSPWPALNQLNGVLSFRQLGMQLSAVQARFEGPGGQLQVRADARVPSLTQNLTVQVGGDVRGPLSEMLGVINGSPLSDLTQDSLQDATSSGTAETKLRLNLPIFNLADSKVLGTVSLAGNDFQFNPASPRLSQIRGGVSFDERQFTVLNSRATMLGGEVQLSGGLQRVSLSGQVTSAKDAEPAVFLRAAGMATSEALRREANLGALSRLALHAKGQANYSGWVRVRRGMVESQFSTDLVGMALSLPAPLEKAAAAPLPLRFEQSLLPRALAIGQLRDQLRLELGSVGVLQYERSWGGNLTPQSVPTVLRGAMVIGARPDALPNLPDSGVTALIDMSRLNVDAWEQVLQEAGKPAQRASGTEPMPTTGLADAQAYLPTSLSMRVGELRAGGRSLHNLVLGGTRVGGLWKANLDAGEINGYIEYRQQQPGVGPKLYARLAKLVIAANDAQEVEDLLDQQPASLPSLDVAVDHFELKSRPLGRLEVEASNAGEAREGAVRDWRLTRLAVELPEASFSAQGNWTAVAGPSDPRGSRTLGLQAAKTRSDRRRTSMNLKLNIRDSGELLKRFGFEGVVRGGQGVISGQMTWLGSPFALDFSSMSGQLNLGLESGQFLKADPGIAKLLGVLSLQSLPRRLSLDFRDVFSEGFAFDFIRGDASIEAGTASTNNLQMKGVNAAVLIEGRADLAKETQQLLVRVVPEINAGTASLIATAVNPAIGIGSFLAQLVLRRPLIMATTQSFEISGSWADPKVQKVANQIPGLVGKVGDSGSESPARVTQ